MTDNHDNTQKTTEGAAPEDLNIKDHFSCSRPKSTRICLPASGSLKVLTAPNRSLKLPNGLSLGTTAKRILPVKP